MASCAAVANRRCHYIARNPIGTANEVQMPQFFGQGKPPLGVVFDSDMDAGIDDALALAMLFGFEGKNEARVISISIDRSNLQTAAFCDAVTRFYEDPSGGEGSSPFARP